MNVEIAFKPNEQLEARAGSADVPPANLATGELTEFRFHPTSYDYVCFIRAGALNADGTSALPARAFNLYQLESFARFGAKFRIRDLRFCSTAVV